MGNLFIILQLGLIFSISVMICIFFKSSTARVLVSIGGAIFLTFQICSIYFGGTLIDYKFYMHLNINDILMVTGFYIVPIIIIGVIFLALIFVINWLGKHANKRKIIQKRYAAIAIILSLVVLGLKGNALGNIFEIISLINTTDRSFHQALNSLGIPPNQYVVPGDVKATKGKNIIVISLESVEKDYLSDTFAHITPNLRKYSETMTYFDMPQSYGSDWTTASIYTLLTGVPALFPGHGNEIFQESQSVKITGISHILKNAGYSLTYLIGNADFGGIKSLLTAYGIETKSQNDFKNEYSLIPSFGLHDKDLFAEAKQIILDFKKKGKPYALFMSTISTHFPNGIYDKRMERVISKQKSDMEFMVASVDYLIDDFIGFLKSEGTFSNTAIFILPDHLLMGKTTPILRSFSKDRGLYLITNIKEELLSFKTKNRLYQIDLPKIILEGAQVKHNAKFLAEFIKNKNKSHYIEKNKKNLFALNKASLSKQIWTGDLTISVNSAKQIELKSDDTKLVIDDIDHEKHPIKIFIFDDEMRLRKNSAMIINALYYFKFSDSRLYLILKIDQEGISACLKKGNGLGTVRAGKNQVIFLKEEIEALNVWNKIVPKPVDTNYHSPIDFLYLTSSTLKYHPANPSRIKVVKKQFSVSKGINLLSRNKGSFVVNRLRAFGRLKAIGRLIRKIKNLNENKQFYALIVHGSVPKNLKYYAKELNAIGFSKLMDLKPGEAYIGYSYKGFISEYSAKNTLSFVLPARDPVTLRTDAQIEKDARDVPRFIAHAGGKIDGYIYTNTLEALNNSYKIGFRLFELDIIKTSDDRFVAAHDWKTWAKQTGYKGKLPVSSTEFLKYKIWKKYTPLNMQRINKWFTQHPDAILVTDKINEPKEFSEVFIDKKRLMMELKTMEAVKEGLAAGIKSAMPSQEVIERIKGDKVSVLARLGIKHVAVSRRMIPSNIPFFKSLQANKIKAYVFNVNFDLGKDESYVVSNEMDYIYGLYADKWNYFNN
ncbi:MAG: sulfatase-like hydrolase/transferase [bacterium]|nr:sulfatase-like hydrolase/transferase [bacterium]